MTFRKNLLSPSLTVTYWEESQKFSPTSFLPTYHCNVATDDPESLLKQRRFRLVLVGLVLKVKMYLSTPRKRATE
jgi:hypothetical protein